MFNLAGSESVSRPIEVFSRLYGWRVIRAVPWCGNTTAGPGNIIVVVMCHCMGQGSKLLRGWMFDPQQI